MVYAAKRFLRPRGSTRPLRSLHALRRVLPMQKLVFLLALPSPLRLAFADVRCTCPNKLQGHTHTRRPEQASLLLSPPHRPSRVLSSPALRARFTTPSTQELGNYPLHSRPCSLCRSYAISTITLTSQYYVPRLHLPSVMYSGQPASGPDATVT